MTVESYVAPKGLLKCRRCQRFGHTQRNCGYSPRCVACGAPTSVDARTRGNSLSVVAAGVTTRTTGVVLSGIRRRRLLQGRRPSMGERASPQATMSPPRKPSWPGPLLSRWTWARGEATSSEERVVKPTTPSPNPNRQRFTEAPKQLIVTATRKKAKPKKREATPTAAPKPATIKPKTKAAASVKTVADKPTTNLVYLHNLPLPH